MVDFEDTFPSATYFADDDTEEVVAVVVETPTETDVADAATAHVVVVVKHLAVVGIIAADVVAVAGTIVVVHVTAVGTSGLAAVEIVVVVAEAHSIVVNDTVVDVDAVVD